MIQTITGYSGRSIDIRTELNNSNKIAFFYPGMRYGSDAPLFYYLIRLLHSEKIDICFFEYDWYKLSLNENLSKSEVIKIVKSEILSSIDSIMYLKKYEHKYLLAKSMGTLVAETFPEEIMAEFEKKFYFTPYIDLEKCIDDNSYLYYGGEDPYIDPKYRKEFYAPGCHYYPDVNHSLMIHDDISKSLRAMDTIISDFKQDLNNKR